MNERENIFQMVETEGNFKVEPLEERVDFKHGFTKLELNDDQKKHISALSQYVPSAVATETLSQAYIAKFPDGLQHTLTKLKQGGVMSMYQDSSGHFAGTASLYSVRFEAAALSVFNTMSIVTGQYYLKQINSELKMISMNIDKILEFLYGDKKAELLAEVSFVKYAYQNYSLIMEQESQRIATITSLQNARKVAMKDIEFYMSDLDSNANDKDNSDIEHVIQKSFNIKESLELSMQLYGISSVLEVYYAQNFAEPYIQYIENEMSSYIDKCERRMLSSFSILNKRIVDYKGKFWEKINKSSYEKSIGTIVDSLGNGEESALRKSLKAILREVEQEKEYYILNDGNVYLKAQ